MPWRIVDLDDQGRHVAGAQIGLNARVANWMSVFVDTSLMGALLSAAPEGLVSGGMHLNLGEVGCRFTWTVGHSPLPMLALSLDL